MRAASAPVPAPPGARCPLRPGALPRCRRALRAGCPYYSRVADGSAALLSRDRAAFLAGVDPDAPAAFRGRQAALFDDLAQVPLAQWRFTVDPALQQAVTAPVFARYRAPVWAPQVTLCYAVRGYDD